jgi:hypothetical protein
MLARWWVDGDAAVRPVRKLSGRNHIVTSQHTPAPTSTRNAVTPPTIALHISLPPEYMPTTSDLPRTLRTPRAPRPSLP